ncbi:MAG TPA: ABC transporter permease [Myxococcota bacterium]|nr:ABC transporter permease [Myxococcota bacterium]
MKYLPLVIRNLGRNKIRSLLTGFAIAISIALVCILRTMPAGLDNIIARASGTTRISTHNEAGIVYSLPYAYLAKVRAVPGVSAAISWNWFGGAVDVTKGVEFANFAVDPDQLAQVYPDWNLPQSAFDDFAKYRNAALVNQATLDQQKWKVGDEVTLTSTVFPVSLTFKIVGAIPQQGNTTFYFQREYLAQALQDAGVNFDTTGMIWSRVDDPGRVGAVMAQIDELFHNSDAVTTSETESSFVGNFFSSIKQIVAIIQIVAGVVTLCIVFIAANTASMSIRERVGEIAILKAMGFRKQTIFATLLAEAGLLALVAGAAGALVAWGGLELLHSKFNAAQPGGMGALTSFVVSGTILVQAIFVSFFIGILSGWIPALGASRRSVAQTLREVF